MNERNRYKKHLTLDDRISIQKGLHDRKSLRQIALSIGKDPSTIPKEIKKHTYPKLPKFPICTKRENCSKSALITDCRYCTDFSPLLCGKLSKSPYVCNPCSQFSFCHLLHWVYDARLADKDYHFSWSEARTGINMDPLELSAIDEWLSPLIQKGQPASHIFENHGADLPFSKRTFYSYLDAGVFSARNLDLHRRVRYKKRRKRVKNVSVSCKFRTHRSYDDYQDFISKNPNLNPVQMDTVIGRNGGKALLTFGFPAFSFMLIFLLPEKTQKCVSDIFYFLQRELGLELFNKIFPVILTDAGSEFLDPWALENDSFGNRRTNIFYCDPYSPWQKGFLERNHEYIRYVLPSGTSFDHLSQKQVTLLMNHINSTSRESLNGSTPFRLSLLLLPHRLHQALGLIEIPPDEVLLKSNLLK